MKKIFFALTVFLLLLSTPCLAGEWNLTGSLNQGREEFCSVILDDGRVFVAGGIANSVELSYCEIYNPQTEEWTIASPMHYARSGKDFISRISDVEILATGQGGPDRTSEIYNLITGEWTLAGNMQFWHKNHTTEAFKNASGDTLFMVIGGDAINDYKGCEVYNPITGEWTITGFLPSGKRLSPSKVLPNGNIISASGGNSTYDWSQCAIYNPATGEWTEIAPLNQGRLDATMELDNDNPMIIGGVYGNIFLNSCEVYNPQTNEWHFIDTLAIGRTGHCSETLLNNKILVMGGLSDQIGTDFTCEIYDYATNQWETATSTYYPYSNFATEILFDERVLAIRSWCEVYAWNYMPIIYLSGLTEALVGDILTFSVTATDPDNDSVSVRVDWDDGEISDWTGIQSSGSTFILSHSWNKCGTTYKVRAQSADQWYFLNELCHNSLSEWGDTLLVTIHGQSFDPSYGHAPIMSAYPNPFRISTTISFNLLNEQAENTEIIIYNIKGQEVKTFISFPNRGLGTREVVWDGTDETGMPVGSGIYFFTFKLGEEIKASNKMLFFR